MYSIKTFSLVKDFKNIRALDNINIDIKEGEIFSLLGPNGAGKTTLISILTTILKPTSGTANVAGYDIIKNPLEVRKQIGIVFQEPSLDDLLTAEENLMLHGMLYDIKHKELKKRVDELLNMVGLKERAKHQVKTFSGGMKRRLEIARGILHIPKILFLDEPTLGLDPSSRREIWKYILKIKKENNITIILTTHYLEEADSLSDRIAIINKGKIIELDSPYNLKKKLGDEILKIKGKIDIQTISKLNFIKKITQIDDFFIITAKEITPHISEIIKYVKDIKDIEIKKTSLEDVFLNIAGKKIDELHEQYHSI
ncbi:MAG: ATP-binding cassette domain-containing protein [Elusimicrobiales bacterium]|nr:ATP-binding cassette domain-containing protein [Elusimicrobiales bacterium]